MNKIEAILQSISLQDVLQRDGIKINHNKINCFIHDDKSPSMTIFRAIEGYHRYHCHACGASGNVIHYWEHTRNLDRKDAINSIMETYGLTATNNWDYIKRQQTELQKKLDKQSEYDTTWMKLYEKAQAIRDWIESNKPKQIGDEFNSALNRAYDKLAWVDYLMDGLYATSHDWDEKKKKWFKGDDVELREFAFEEAKNYLGGDSNKYRQNQKTNG